MKSSIYLLAGAIMILTSGCCTQTHLGYCPAYPVQEPKNVSVAVAPFEDLRGEDQAIGVIRNLFYMPMFVVKTVDNVPKWMVNAFREELENAGYDIVRGLEGSDYVIEGKILDLESSSYANYYSHINVELALKEGEAIVFQRQYATDLTEPGEGILLSTGQHAITLGHNLQKICMQFINDLNNYRLSTSEV